MIDKNIYSIITRSKKRFINNNNDKKKIKKQKINDKFIELKIHSFKQNILNNIPIERYLDKLTIKLKSDLLNSEKEYIKTIQTENIDNDYIILDFNKDINQNNNITKKKCKNNKNKEYFKKLSKKKKKYITNIKNEIKEYKKEIIPIKYKILLSNTDIYTKSIILDDIKKLDSMDESDNEYNKLKKKIDGITKLPFGIYKKNIISKTNNNDELNKYFKKTYDILNESTYGQHKVKNKIMEIMAQWINNPNSKSKILALVSPPGMGKTSLVKNGISKALDRPFKFLSIGAITDESTLKGHHYTWEGSTWGKLSSTLMETKCMNPIILLDEIDKIPINTRHGDKIKNVLIQILDTTQNDSFEDEYFGIKTDLSKVLFIATLNDKENIDRVLSDRITFIEMEKYSLNDKIKIGKDYLIPNILQNYGLNNNDIIFNDDILTYIINNYAKKEEGVRELDRQLESIISKINRLKLNNTNKDIPYYIDNFNIPFTITNCIIDKLLNKKKNMLNPSIQHLYL
jgi:ATP-dependent Lon protease